AWVTPGEMPVHIGLTAPQGCSETAADRRLEDQSHPKLDLATRVGGCNYSKRGTKAGIGSTEDRRVGKVDKLGQELEGSPLRNGERLRDADIGCSQSWTAEGPGGTSAEGSRRGRSHGSWIQVLNAQHSKRARTVGIGELAIPRLGYAGHAVGAG